MMMSKIYQLLLKMTLFLFMSGLLYVALVCVWSTFLPKRYTKNVYRNLTNTYVRFQDAKNTEEVQLVFTGSSHAYRGFDTRIFMEAGITSFNLGSSSQTPLQSELLLQKYIDNLRPKLVVLEVYPNTFTMDGVESSLDIISNNPDIDYIGLTAKHHHVRVLNTAIFSLYRKFWLGFPSTEEVKLPNWDTYIEGGYVERSLKHYDPSGKSSEVTLKFNEDQFETLSDIIAFLQENDIKVIMVTAPLAPSVYNRYTNYDTFDKRMEAYGEYYNFNERLQLNDSLYFFDSHHLNQYGVEVFNRDLINLINEKGYLK